MAGMAPATARFQCGRRRRGARRRHCRATADRVARRRRGGGSGGGGPRGRAGAPSWLVWTADPARIRRAAWWPRRGSPEDRPRRVGGRRGGAGVPSDEREVAPGAGGALAGRARGRRRARRARAPDRRWRDASRGAGDASPGTAPPADDPLRRHAVAGGRRPHRRRCSTRCACATTWSARWPRSWRPTSGCSAGWASTSTTGPPSSSRWRCSRCSSWRPTSPTPRTAGKPPPESLRPALGAHLRDRRRRAARDARAHRPPAPRPVRGPPADGHPRGRDRGLRGARGLPGDAGGSRASSR